MTTIVLTGGGSGGHITPLLAVAHELKRIKPDARIVYIGQTGDNLASVVANSNLFDEIYSVQAGKFRRYNKSKLAQLVDIPTIAKNIRDFGRLILGLWQSWWLLKRIKPNVIFIKGGYVGVPVGLAAAKQHIPYITHDSDAIPGLANRIIARWTTAYAVALPKETYPHYPPEKTFVVGVPVAENFQLITPATQQQFREELHLGSAKQILLVTGGGQGAQQLNRAIADCSRDLLKKYQEMMIVIAVGHKNEKEMTTFYHTHLDKEEQKRVIIKDYLEDLYRYSGAADLIVTRAGATSIAEFAAQAKACILVPNPYLTAGHQLKNAQLLADKGAVSIVNDDKLTNSKKLMETIITLLESPHDREILGQQLHKFAHRTAAKELAQLLLNTVS